MNFPESRSFRIISRKGELYLYKDGWTFNLSPPEIIKLQIPPYVEGVDWFVRSAMKIKGISSESMKVSFNSEIFMGCDVRLDSPEKSYGGWIYSVNDEFLGISPDRKIWICEHMKIYFDEAPQRLFVSLEEQSVDNLDRKPFPRLDLQGRGG